MSDPKKTQYKVKFEIDIRVDRGTCDYSAPAFRLSLEEQIPAGKDPVLYTKARLKEEMDRRAPHVKFEDVVVSIDPLDTPSF